MLAKQARMAQPCTPAGRAVGRRSRPGSWEAGIQPWSGCDCEASPSASLSSEEGSESTQERASSESDSAA
eukprot:10700006-Alexandrium_andersonii.AAC.1